MNLSLRTRLVLTATLLVGIGLIASDIAAVTTLRSYLVKQIDRQLVSARSPVSRHLTTRPGTTTSTETSTASTTPSSTPTAAVTRNPQSSITLPQAQQERQAFFSDLFIEIFKPDGTIDRQVTPITRNESEPTPNVTPATVQSHLDKGPFTLASTSHNDQHFRAIATRTQDGDTLVAAISLRNAHNTINNLEKTELIVTITIICSLAAFAWWIVRVELRQIDQMAGTADAIAAGDLSRRVTVNNVNTEVGKLGTALNSMLSQIEESFEERNATEQRLRRFAVDASHELRTPLTAIRGYAELYRQGAIAGEEHLHRVMHRIEHEAQRMGTIVEDLLLLARLDLGRPLETQPIDIIQVLHDTVDDACVIDPTRDITLNTPDTPFTVTGDAIRLHQVFANLIGNALTHTPGETTIKVTARQEPAQSPESVSGKTTAVAIIEVEDTGPGLNAEDAARVFERFFRVDEGRARSTGGTGLGLAIVQSIVTAHGGTVSVSSSPGNGATFRVELPLASPGAASRRAL